MKTTIPRARRRYARMFAPDLSKGSNSMLDGRVLPFAEAEEMRNIVAVSGALKNGYGADATAVPALYDKVFYYAAFDEDAGTEKGSIWHIARRTAKCSAATGRPILGGKSRARCSPSRPWERGTVCTATTCFCCAAKRAWP